MAASNSLLNISSPSLPKNQPFPQPCRCYRLVSAFSARAGREIVRCHRFGGRGHTLHEHVEIHVNTAHAQKCGSYPFPLRILHTSSINLRVRSRLTGFFQLLSSFEIAPPRSHRRNTSAILAHFRSLYRCQGTPEHPHAPKTRAPFQA